MPVHVHHAAKGKVIKTKEEVKEAPKDESKVPQSTQYRAYLPQQRGCFRAKLPSQLKGVLTQKEFLDSMHRINRPLRHYVSQDVTVPWYKQCFASKRKTHVSMNDTTIQVFRILEEENAKLHEAGKRCQFGHETHLLYIWINVLPPPGSAPGMEDWATSAHHHPSASSPTAGDLMAALSTNDASAEAPPAAGAAASPSAGDLMAALSSNDPFADAQRKEGQEGATARSPTAGDLMAALQG